MSEAVEAAVDKALSIQYAMEKGKDVAVEKAVEVESDCWLFFWF